MRKDSGEANSTIIETMVCAFLLSLFLVIVFVYGNQLLTYIKIEHVARNYMQEMEVYGCLTPEMEVSLIDELEDLGLKNVNCNSSTLTKTANGNEIVLDIQADLLYTFFDTDTFITKRTENYNFHMVKTSISKSY